MSINNGKDFVYILKTINNIGYNAQWQLINSKWFLPQNRERVYFIGYIRKTSTPKILPIGSCYTDNNKKLIKIGYINNKNYQQNRIYSTKGIAVNLNSGGGGWGTNTGLYKDKKGIRRLTPIECERLQGFDDNYTAGLSDTARYRILGNAVTVPVVKEIGKNLYKTI